jgi:hypothetical protein
VASGGILRRAIEHIDGWMNLATGVGTSADKRTGFDFVRRLLSAAAPARWMGKFNADLHRSRQQELGVDGYIWRRKLDNREREEHVAREGQRFSWSQPPRGRPPRRAGAVPLRGGAGSGCVLGESVVRSTF